MHLFGGTQFAFKTLAVHKSGKCSYTKTVIKKRFGTGTWVPVSSVLNGPPFWYSTFISTLLAILSNDGNSNKTILPLEIMQSLLSFKHKHASSFPDWLLLLSSSMSWVFCSFNMICIFLFILGFIGLLEPMFWCLSSVVDNSQPLFFQILLRAHFLYSFLTSALTFSVFVPLLYSDVPQQRFGQWWAHDIVMKLKNSYCLVM